MIKRYITNQERTWLSSPYGDPDGDDPSTDEDGDDKEIPKRNNNNHKKRSPGRYERNEEDSPRYNEDTRGESNYVMGMNGLVKSFDKEDKLGGLMKTT